MEIWIKTEEYNEVVVEPDPDDHWDQGIDRVHTTFLWAQPTPAAYPFSSITLEPGFDFQVGNEVYVAYAIYENGNTFGSTGGLIEFLGAGSYDYCKALEDSVLNDTYDEYAPWRGYFARLEGTDIVTLPIRGS